ncbi:hypothetical protein DBR40_23615 [Pedobacter sp. KBW01]|nr:hypothetical protein DBR40_23615 [Pedobacter sp. KBW01]
MFIDKFEFWTSQMWKTFLLKPHQGFLARPMFHGLIGSLLPCQKLQPGLLFLMINLIFVFIAIDLYKFAEFV